MSRKPRISSLPWLLPAVFAESTKNNLFLSQGSADWRTPASPTLELVRKLYELKRSVRFALVEGGTHGLRVPLRDYLLHDWLDRYVRDRAPLPNLTLHGE